MACSRGHWFGRGVNLECCRVQRIVCRNDLDQSTKDLGKGTVKETPPPEVSPHLFFWEEKSSGLSPLRCEPDGAMS